MHSTYHDIAHHRHKQTLRAMMSDGSLNISAFTGINPNGSHPVRAQAELDEWFAMFPSIENYFQFARGREEPGRGSLPLSQLTNRSAQRLWQ